MIAYTRCLLTRNNPTIGLKRSLEATTRCYRAQTGRSAMFLLQQTAKALTISDDRSLLQLPKHKHDIIALKEPPVSA